MLTYLFVSTFTPIFAPLYITNISTLITFFLLILLLTYLHFQHLDLHLRPNLPLDFFTPLFLSLFSPTLGFASIPFRAKRKIFSRFNSREVNKKLCRKTPKNI